MTSSAPAATGMSITGAGASSVLTGASGSATGLNGVFAALVGSSPTLSTDAAATAQAPVAATGNDGMISVLLGGMQGTATGGKTGTATFSLSDLAGLLTGATTTTQTDVTLGDAQPLTVTGDATTVTNFVQQLKDIYQKVVVDGGLTIGQLSDSKELAGALTKLGMSPDQATGVAERIETMLKLLKEQQDVSDATAGSLVAMMLTVMGQQVPGAATAATSATTQAQNFGLQIVSLEQAPASTGTAAKLTAWQMRAGGDVTRDLLGLDKAQDSDKVAVDGDKVRKLEVAVTTDGDAGIAVAMPEVKVSGNFTPVAATAIDAKPSDAAQAATAITTTGAAVKVAADERIEAPKGETYYKLQADKNGVETLEAVKPASELHDAGLMTQQGAQTPAAQAITAQAAADTTANSAFAERVAQIQAMVDKAEVGKQVSVQMQPLLAEGGGTVRINLHPKDLGQITVELRVTDGKVQGTIAASEPAVVEQLARELHSLRHGLADAGLKLGEQGINLMLSNQGQQGQGGGQNGQQAAEANARNSSGFGTNAGGNTGSGTEELASNISAWVSPDRVLDVNV